MNGARPAPLSASAPNEGQASVGVPRLALSVSEACEALGVGWDFWREHVEPELRVVRRGRRKLVAVSELAAWLDRSAERAL